LHCRLNRIHEVRIIKIDELYGLEIAKLVVIVKQGVKPVQGKCVTKASFDLWSENRKTKF